ncbi:MAG: hypothetical protein P8183_22510, partial [Anaerolineae bacterium]
GLTEADLPPGTVEVTVLDNTGAGVADLNVYAFDEAGNWLGLYKRTNSQGTALFEDMEDGAYQFLTYQSSNYYWSNVITYPRQNQATINLHSQKFTVRVVDKDGKGMKGVYVYAYTANEQYWLGVYGRTGNDGKITVDLPDGDYKFRAYASGHWYWSSTVNSPAKDSTVIEIREYEMTVTVVDDAGHGVKESNLYVYAYTESGDYTGVYGKTNGNGRVKLELPNGTYKFRVYYHAADYWSEAVTIPDSDEAVIKTEERPFTVQVVDRRGRPVKNVWVYAFTGDTAYFGQHGKTDKQGQVVFDLPRGDFKFRVDYDHHSYWSSIVNAHEGSTTITLHEE